MARIPPPRTVMVDPRTGQVTPEWYRWLAQFERDFDNSGTGAGSGLVLDADGDLGIATGGVTRAMLANGLATSVIGRYQGSAGPVADIQATADNRVLGRFGGVLQFRDVTLVPATVADGDYGDITVSGAGAAWDIDADAVDNTKLGNMAQATIKGRAVAAGTGDPVDLTAAQARAIVASDGQALTRTNDTNVTLTLGGTPATALLAGVSLTLGWSGTLSVARGGTGGGSASGTLLDNITGFASTGHLVRTGAGTYAFRTLTGPAAGLSVSNGSGVGGNPTLALADDLSGLEGLSGTGIAARTAASTWTTRTITGTANEITVTNGDGVSGNPTLSLPTSITMTGKTVTGGTFSNLTALTVSNDVTFNNGAGATVLNLGNSTANTKIISFSTGAHFYDAGGHNFRNAAGSTTAMTLSAAGAAAFPNVSTTASAANAYLDNGASNNLLRSTSARRYKKDIRPLKLDQARLLLALEPVTYRSRCEADDQRRRHWGLIADDAHGVGLRALVNYDVEGRPDGFQYERVVVGLLALVRDMSARIAALESGR